MVNKFQMSLQQLQEKVRGQEEVGPPPKKKQTQDDKNPLPDYVKMLKKRNNFTREILYW